MIAKFRELDRAFAYVCEAFAKVPTEDTVELSAAISGGLVLGTRQLAKGNLLTALGRECGRFQQATVVLGTTKSGAPFAGIQCRCTGETRVACPHHCAKSNDRPVLLVRRPVSGETEDRRQVLESVYREIREDVKAEYHRGDAQENPNLNISPESHQAKRLKQYRSWLEHS